MTAWLDPAAAAAHLCVPPRRLQALVRKGKLPRPSYHLGPKSPRWDRDKIDSLLAGRQVRDGMQAALEKALNGIVPYRKKDTGGRHG